MEKKKQFHDHFLLPDPALEDLQRWDKELKETILEIEEAENEWFHLLGQMERFE